jgi:hypothetical protein
MIFVRVLKVNEPTFWMLPHAKSASQAINVAPELKQLLLGRPGNQAL